MAQTPIDRAFDEHKPPERELVEDCVHCGFCLPTCPTYVLWNEEMDSPRGRIVLMSEGLEAGSELTPTMAGHFDNCLGCMACVTACPSGVRYDLLIEDTRQQVERLHERTPRERLLRRALFATFPHPGRLRATVPLIVAYRRSGLAAGLQRSRLLDRLPTLRCGRPSVRASAAPTGRSCASPAGRRSSRRPASRPTSRAPRSSGGRRSGCRGSRCRRRPWASSCTRSRGCATPCTRRPA